jgi:hypothetical protein
MSQRPWQLINMIDYLPLISAGHYLDQTSRHHGEMQEQMVA